VGGHKQQVVPASQANVLEFSNTRASLNMSIARYLLPALCSLLASCSRHQDPSTNGPVEESSSEQQSAPRPVRQDGLLVTTTDAPGLLTGFQGRLAWDGACLVISGSGRTYQTVWPRGTGLDPSRTQVLVPWPEKNSFRVYALGSEIMLPGGVIGHVDGGSPSFAPNNRACTGPGWAVKA